MAEYRSPSKPLSIVIEKISADNLYLVLFRYNIHQVGDDWAYDQYAKSFPITADLADVIKNHAEEYVEEGIRLAKDKKADDIRNKRNRLLSETDYIMLEDYPCDSELKESVKQYRKALRDITLQEDFPDSVTFPDKPF